MARKRLHKRFFVQDHIIIVAFNTSIVHGCDYAQETIRILSKHNSVFGFALGEPITWRIIGENPTTIKKIISFKNNVCYIRPLFVLPGQRYQTIQTFNNFINACLLRLYFMLRYPLQRKLLWVFEPFHVPALLPAFLGIPILYDCVDYFPAFSELAKRNERILLKRATWVVANSFALTKRVRKIRKDTVCVPLGFNSLLFSHAKILGIQKQTPKKQFTVGFIGGIGKRLDVPLLRQVTRDLPDISFLFVGGVEQNVFGTNDNFIKQWNAYKKETNVVWKDNVSKQNVLSVIASFDVCMIPYDITNPFNRYCFPMKTMEYFALGKPVIATDMYSLRPYARRGLLTIIHTSDEFIRNIRSIQRLGWSREKMQQQRQEADIQSWENKVDAIYSVIQRKISSGDL